LDQLNSNPSMVWDLLAQHEVKAKLQKVITKNQSIFGTLLRSV